MEVSIVDYGMGNIRSVRNAIYYLKREPKIVENPEALVGDKIIIPGVGAFGDAMENLGDYLPRIEELLESGASVLGICLGLQIMFEGSDEDPEVDGFGLMKGRIAKLDTDFKLPQIGWNYLEIRDESCPLFQGIEGGYVYYANSYHAEPKEKVRVTRSDYGSEVTAAVWKENIYGMQFHPEKSGRYGLKLLNNFLEV